METGEGLRMLTPSGAVLSGKDAAGRLMAGLRAREILVVLAGYSRGSYAVAWAMRLAGARMAAFAEAAVLDRPVAGARAPAGTSLSSARITGT